MLGRCKAASGDCDAEKPSIHTGPPLHAGPSQPTSLHRTGVSCLLGRRQEGSLLQSGVLHRDASSEDLGRGVHTRLQVTSLQRVSSCSVPILKCCSYSALVDAPASWRAKRSSSPRKPKYGK